MKIIAYSYCDPLLEPPLDPGVWGWEVDRVYTDLGGRQQLQELLSDCRTTPATYLLIRRWEELGDSLEEVNLNIRELESLGINIISTESEVNPKDVLQLLREIQYYQRSRRIRQGHARNRLQGKPPPGKVPYGYKRGKNSYAIDRGAASAVKDFFEQFLLYGSLRGAVRYLEKRYGKKISVSTGRRWLTNPVYRGDTAFRNGEIISDTHVAIISREEAAQVDRILRRNRLLPPRTASVPRSLAGLVVCGSCHSQMTVTRVSQDRKEREYLYLRPRNCPKQPQCKSLHYELVLQETIAAICLDLPGAIGGLQMLDMSQVKSEIQGAIGRQEEILKQLPNLIENGILDAETAEIRAYKLRAEIAELQGRMAELPPVNLRSVAEAVSIPQFWLDLSESERRFYFREFLRQIQIVRKELNTWEVRLIFIF